MIDDVLRGLEHNPRFDRYQVRLAFVREPPAPTRTAPLLSRPEAVYDLFRSMRRLDRECLAVALLDAKHRLVGIHAVHVGTSTQSAVGPSDVFKAAILANAQAIVIVHNHPSGDPAPSPDDVATTCRLKTAGENLGIHVLDHIIVGEEGFVSLHQRGIV